MTVHNLVDEVLKSVINTQRNAYVYAQQLGEQDEESLFPIPVVEIREIVLDFQYAYARPPAKEEEAEEYEAVPAHVYSSLENIYAFAFVKARKALIDEVDLSPASASPNWIAMKASLLRGKLDDYVMSEYRKRFLADAKTLIPSGDFDQQGAQDLLVKVIQDVLVDHKDLKSITSQVNTLPAIREAVDKDLQPQARLISQRFEAAKTRKPREPETMEIIVDSAELGKLSPQSVQSVKIVLDVRSDLNKPI